MRRSIQTLSLLLSMVLILSMFTIVPAAVAGAVEVTGQTIKRVSPESLALEWTRGETTYVDQNGVSRVTRAVRVTEDTTVLSNDRYVVNQSLTIDGRIIVSGDVSLILEDGKTLTAPKGICVNDGASLTIFAQSGGDGALVIDNVDQFNAGIGGDDRVDSGVITINGGNINVTAGLYAAGIGGGYRAKGVVAINGGSIYADGQGSPSIGGGNDGFGSRVTLDWRNPSDSIFADSYSGTVTLKRAFFADGRVLHNGEVGDLSSIDGRTITPHAHTFTYMTEKAATRSAAGHIEYWRCSDCGYYYTDEDGYHEVTQAETVIPMLTGSLFENADQCFARHSLSLNGDICVNFYIDLTAEEVAQGARVDFTWFDQTDSVTLTAADYAADQGLYKAVCDVCAPEMADDITAVLTVDGEEIRTETYSVKSYADTILADKDQPRELKELVSAMLNYGGSAQLLFADEHSNDCGAANDGLAAPVSLTQEELDAIAVSAPGKSAVNARLSGTGLTYCGYSLLLHSKTALRFYFKKESTDTDISGIRLSTGSGDDKVVCTARNYYGSYAYVEMKGIPANELNIAYELSVNGTMLGSYSVLNYIRDVLTDDSFDETLVDAMTAMYRYHEAAVAYFNHRKN